MGVKRGENIVINNNNRLYVLYFLFLYFFIFFLPQNKNVPIFIKIDRVVKSYSHIHKMAKCWSCYANKNCDIEFLFKRVVKCMFKYSYEMNADGKYVIP